MNLNSQKGLKKHSTMSPLDPASLDKERHLTNMAGNTKFFNWEVYD